VGARPGDKRLVLKNHEAPSISWTKRANRPRIPAGVPFPGKGA
jgi:hypothetical protein